MHHYIWNPEIEIKSFFTLLVPSLHGTEQRVHGTGLSGRQRPLPGGRAAGPSSSASGRREPVAGAGSHGAAARGGSSSGGRAAAAGSPDAGARLHLGLPIPVSSDSRSAIVPCFVPFRPRTTIWDDLPRDEDRRIDPRSR
jgi:hypothetical protein